MKVKRARVKFEGVVAACVIATTRVSAEEADTRWDNSAQATMEACIKSAISFNGLYDFEGRADTRMKDMERGGWRRGKSPAWTPGLRLPLRTVIHQQELDVCDSPNNRAQKELVLLLWQELREHL